MNIFYSLLFVIVSACLYLSFSKGMHWVKVALFISLIRNLAPLFNHEGFRESLSKKDFAYKLQNHMMLLFLTFMLFFIHNGSIPVVFISFMFLQFCVFFFIFGEEIGTWILSLKAGQIIANALAPFFFVLFVMILREINVQVIEGARMNREQLQEFEIVFNQLDKAIFITQSNRVQHIAELRCSQ